MRRLAAAASVAAVLAASVAGLTPDRPAAAARTGLEAGVPAVRPVTATVPLRADATRGHAPAGRNLLLNPGAEVGGCTTSGYDRMTVPGWTVDSGSPDSVCYGAVGFPRVGTPGPPDAGRAFFSGGATGDARLSQRIDLSSAVDAIDDTEVTFDLSGWVGGFAGQNDRATVTAEFADKAGNILGTGTLRGVTNSDRDLTTELVAQDATGDIPVNTRSVTITVAFTWTAGDTTDGYVDDLSFATSTRVAKPVLKAPSTAVVPKFDHVFFVFMENENYGPLEAPTHKGDYIVTNGRAPYLNGPVKYSGSLLSEMYATTHPSDPNYLAVTGGSTFGRTDNPTVGQDRINARNLGDLLEAQGKTWKGYAEGMAYPCDTSTHNNAAGGYYLPDDEPFMLYADVIGNQKRCAAHNQPFSQMATDLRKASTTPNFVWFAANDVNNMEDGGVATGDRWLARVLPEIMSSPAWTTQRSLLIVSWDEGHTKAFGPDYPNHIPTYVLASQGLVKADYLSHVRYDDYSLGATVEAALGLPPMTSNDRYAAPLSDIWTSSGTGGGMPPGAEAAFPGRPALRQP